MFTHNTRKTGNGTQRSAVTRVAAFGAAAALGSGLALAAPLAASADTANSASAQGQFLSGSIAGTNLSRVAALGPATASNNGTQSTQVSRDPLAVSALNQTLINQPSGVQLNLGQIVDLGALSQYAQAGKDGTSMAASGAVNNDGGIGAGQVGDNSSGSASVDLDSLLDSRFAKVLSDMDLKASAVAAQANAKQATASGRYSLSGLTLDFTSPAISGLDSKVNSALAPVTAQLASLDGSNGELAGSVNKAVTGISPALGILGTKATVNANVNADVKAAVEPLLTGTYSSDGVTMNLQTGAVSVDLATLLGGKLNSEPAGTQVLSDAVVNQVLNNVTRSVASLADQVKNKVSNALGNAKVNVDVALDQSTPQTPVPSKVCTPAASGGLLGGVVGGLLCNTTTKALPALQTNLGVHVHGTVSQIVSGHAPQATANVKLLGQPVSINTNNIVSGLGKTLNSHLLGSTSAVSQLGDSLDTKLVDPAATALTGSNASVGTALKSALSVTLNNQAKNADGTFTETALRVQAAPALSATGDLATINLASATVGPNVSRVVAPGSPTDPGAPGAPGGSTTVSAPSGSGGSGGSGGANSAVSPASFSNLAFTGVGIATLVAVILALLAAGAYLVREGYRRNSRRQIL
ncbi:MAG TPA: choice-of-anchor G family protein [Galbitalea sp.]